jgi:hypothetical protein
LIDRRFQGYVPGDDPVGQRQRRPRGFSDLYPSASLRWKIGVNNINLPFRSPYRSRFESCAEVITIEH